MIDMIVQYTGVSYEAALGIVILVSGLLLLWFLKMAMSPRGRRRAPRPPGPTKSAYTPSYDAASNNVPSYEVRAQSAPYALAPDRGDQNEIRAQAGYQAARERLEALEAQKMSEDLQKEKAAQRQKAQQSSMAGAKLEPLRYENGPYVADQGATELPFELQEKLFARLPDKGLGHYLGATRTELFAGLLFFCLLAYFLELWWIVPLTLLPLSLYIGIRARSNHMTMLECTDDVMLAVYKFILRHLGR